MRPRKLRLLRVSQCVYRHRAYLMYRELRHCDGAWVARIGGLVCIDHSPRQDLGGFASLVSDDSCPFVPCGTALCPKCTVTCVNIVLERRCGIHVQITEMASNQIALLASPREEPIHLLRDEYVMATSQRQPEEEHNAIDTFQDGTRCARR
jgi:hypothetical protein